MRFSIILFAFVTLCMQPTSAQPLILDSTELTVEAIAENLETPWEILWGPDDMIWMTERKGVVSRVDPVTGNVDELLKIDEVGEYGEGGLLGIVLHPNFEHPDSQFVYLVYNYDDGIRYERLVRYTYDKDTLINPVILLDDIPGKYNHIGSRLIILQDRTILMSTGDAANSGLSQDTSSLAGKFLRLNLDGSVPDDNPFPGSYIWSIGHRNPQGLVQTPNGILYSSEHGPSNDDELNILAMSGNYGWPDVMGFCDLPAEQTYCTDNNIVEPIIAWTPTLAVCGLDYYDHDAIPEWKNSLLLVSLKESDFRVLKLNEPGDSILSEDIYFDREYGRLRDICISPKGEIFFSTSNHDGRGNPVETDDRIIKVSNEQYSGPTGIDEYNVESKLRFYPNPVENTIYLDHESVQSYRIYDLSSRLVSQGRYARTVDVSELQEGIYILEIQVENAILKGKFLKK